MNDRRSRPHAWTAALVVATLGHAALAAADSLSDQVRQSLATTGTVDALAATALREPARDAETLLGQARLAVEAGNLDVALPLWKALADGPSRGDPAVWGEVANLSELLGRDDAAERAWQAVIDCAPTDGDVANDARLRLAMLRLDAGRPAEARPVLDAVAASPGGAARAGVVAALYGQHDAAAGYLIRVPGRTVADFGRASVVLAPPGPEAGVAPVVTRDGASDCDAAPTNGMPSGTPSINASSGLTVGLQLLAGNVALQAGQLGPARVGFEWAADHATDVRDRRYATERLLAVAAKDGTLDALATRWLADPNLKPERCLPLAIVLRQAGRDAELLSWWRRDVGAGPRRDVLLSNRFLSEVAAAALSTRGAGGVRGICEELLGPGSQQEASVPVVARLLLSSGDATGADALLDREADGAAGDAACLEGLGKVARSLGRDEVAHRVADRLVAIGGTAAIRGLLLDGSVSLRADDHDRAAGALRRAAKLALDHPELGPDVAAELDGAGLDDEAIALLRATAADDDGLLQLSGLLVQQQRAPEATAVLNRLRRTTKSPGAAAQAGQRMLEIAGATDGFEGLATTLRATLDGDGGTAGDVSLLADVYLAMHRSEAAVTLIESTPLLDQPTRLRRLSTLFLRMREYGRADEVLRQIAASEPANAVATLEQIAWVATERKRGDDATAAIGEIAERVGTGATADELMGGIYDRLGWPGEAATRYRRAIAAGGSAEDWLLWSTAITKAGQPDVAGQRLQMLCGEGPSDAVFAVAVDGLLGVDTPVPALRAVRRAAVLRAARSPGEATLLHLVGDLSDELGDAAFGRRASETAVAFATEERPQLLRELAEQAAAAGDVDGAIAAGTSILASGDDFPPQVFLDLGEQLLVAGRPGDAARALGRAADGPGGEMVLPRVAALYTRYGYHAQAAAALAAFLDRHPYDLTTTETLAGEEEVLGQPGEAFRLYLRAIDLCLKRGAVDPSEATDAGAVNRLTASALATARSGGEQASLVQLLRHHLDRWVADSARGGASNVPDAVATLAGAVRQAAFVAGDLAAAEQSDGLLFTTWPDDRAFRRAALAARVDAGLFGEARRFAEGHGLRGQLPVDQGTMPRLEATALPSLIADGEMDLAGRVVRSTADVSPTDADRTVPMLIAGAAAVGDEGAITRWSLRWLAIAGAPLERAEVRGANGGREAAAARRHIAAVASAVWGVLPTAGRRTFIQALLDTGREAPPAGDAPAVLAIRLAAAGGIDLPEDRAALADRLLRSPASADAVAAELFEWFPAVDRPALLRVALERIAPAHRLAFLLGVTDRTTEPFDDETGRIIVDAAAAIPTGQVVSPSEWFTNGAQRRVLPALAEAVLRTRAGEAAGAGTAVPCAAALAIGGDAGRADGLAMAAIERLWSQVPGPPTVDPPDDPTADALRWLRVAWGALSAQGRSAVLRSVTSEHPGDTAWRQRCAATLLREAGRPAEALALERRTFGDHPNDDGAAAALAEGLAADGRLAELVDTFGPASGRAWAGAVRRAVVAGLGALGRNAEARRLSPADAGVAAGEGPEAMAETGRLRLERARAREEPFDGGVVVWPGAAADLVATLRALPVPVREDDPSVAAMVRAVGEVVGRSPEGRGALLDALAARATEGTFLAADGLVLEQLAMDRDVRLAPPLVDALRLRAGATAEDGAFEALAGAAEAAGSPAAGGLRAWVAARRRMDGSDGAVVPADPLTVPVDGALAEALGGLIDRGALDGAERELAALRAHGQVGRRQAALGMVWARLAAERGDLARFGARWAEALEGARWEPDEPVPDVRLALPGHGDAVAIATAAAEVIERAAEGDRGRAGFAVALARVGSWAHDRGATAAARDLLDRAVRLAAERGAGEDALAAADLADQLGDGRGRDEIELGLLRERRLPSGRIVPLIGRLAAGRPRAEVERLARDAAMYCREPGLGAWFEATAEPSGGHPSGF